MERTFREKVKELIGNDGDRERLFDALRQYQSNQDLDLLLLDLKSVLNEPNKLELYEFMRPLVLRQHQIAYSLGVPLTPGVKLRVVHLQRHHRESLGFSVRGGFEHGVGIFVTEVTPGSQAHRQGLRVGDEIVRVNGFTISEAIHDDALRLIRSRDDIILKVTYIGMLPVKDNPEDSVTWKYVEESHTENGAGEGRPERDIKLFIDSTGYASIGCGVLSGPPHFPGIFIERVKPGSLAQEIGLEVGDQLVEVNDKNFQNITHNEAVLALRSSRQLNIVIRKGVGLKLMHLSRANPPAMPSPSPSSVPKAIDEGVTNAAPSSDHVEQAFRHTPPVQPPPKLATNERPLPHVQLDEAQLIERQLNMKPIFGLAKKPLSTPVHSLESETITSSTISTSAEVYETPHMNSLEPTRDEQLPENGEGSYSLYSRVSPLGGAAAMMEERRLKSDQTTMPSLLGLQGDFEWTNQVPQQIYDKFGADLLDGRLLCGLNYKKTEDLGIEIEGGLGSPLGGRIMVAMVFDGGIAEQSRKMHVGDQLMMINGSSLLDISVSEAERMIQEASGTLKEKVELIYCESTLVNDEDSITYF